MKKIETLKIKKTNSEDELIKILSKPKPKLSLSKKKIKKIREEFNKLRHRFLSSK